MSTKEMKVIAEMLHALGMAIQVEKPEDKNWWIGSAIQQLSNFHD